MQTPQYVVILQEMIHDARIIPIDGRPHALEKRPPLARRLARALGGRHAGRRHDEPHRQRARLSVPIAVLGLVLPSTPVPAHHAFGSEFNVDNRFRCGGS